MITTQVNIHYQDQILEFYLVPEELGREISQWKHTYRVPEFESEYIKLDAFIEVRARFKNTIEEQLGDFNSGEAQRLVAVYFPWYDPLNSLIATVEKLAEARKVEPSQLQISLC